MLFDDTLRSLLQPTRTVAIPDTKDKAGQAVDTVVRCKCKYFLLQVIGEQA